MKLHTIKPEPGSQAPGQAPRLRRELRPRQDLRQGQQGPEGPFRRRHPRRLRRRPDAPSPPPAQAGFNNFDFRDVVGTSSTSRDLDGRVRRRRRRSTRQRSARPGLVNGRCDKVKVLGNGEVTKKPSPCEVDKVSASAREKIEKAGGNDQQRLSDLSRFRSIS